MRAASDRKIKTAMIISTNQSQWLQFPSLSSLLNISPDIMIILVNDEDNDDHTIKFYAHRSVLASHSAYFRTLFTNCNDYEVRLTHIRGEIFSLLFAYMYSGLLTLTYKNVYEIFLASSSLEMVVLMNHCKQFIQENLDRETRNTSVIKPVPRKSTLCEASSAQYHEMLKYQPLRINEQLPSIFKPVTHGNIVEIEPSPRSHRDEKKELRCNTKSDENNQNNSGLKSGSTITTNTVVYDIACCDGPIKFQRVINEFYEPHRSTSDATEFIRNKSADKHSLRQDYKVFITNFKPFRKSYFDGGGASVNNHTDRIRPQTVYTESTIEKRTTGINKFHHKNGTQYPCKNCGSKFPSYYFVNKHRKQCHVNERSKNDKGDRNELIYNQ